MQQGGPGLLNGRASQELLALLIYGTCILFKADQRYKIILVKLGNIKYM